MDIIMKDSESAFSAVPVQLTATFRIVGLLCCETKRMVWFSLEPKDWDHLEVKLIHCFFGVGGGFSIIQTESIDLIWATDTLSSWPSRPRLRSSSCSHGFFSALGFNFATLPTSKYDRLSSSATKILHLIHRWHKWFKMSLARTWTSAGLWSLILKRHPRV